MAKEEQWLPIPGFPGYDVSDLGKVRSYWVQNVHPSRVSDTPQQMKKIHTGGSYGTNYLYVQVSCNGHLHRLKIHELIALVFSEKKKEMITENRNRKREEMRAKLASMDLLQDRKGN